VVIDLFATAALTTMFDPSDPVDVGLVLFGTYPGAKGRTIGSQAGYHHAHFVKKKFKAREHPDAVQNVRNAFDEQYCCTLRLRVSRWHRWENSGEGVVYYARVCDEC
jgi:hypothetical protein